MVVQSAIRLRLGRSVSRALFVLAPLVDAARACSAGTRLWPIAIVIFCALLFFPLRFLSEANPDWRLLSWALSLVAITITASCIF